MRSLLATRSLVLVTAGLTALALGGCGSYAAMSQARQDATQAQSQAASGVEKLAQATLRPPSDSDVDHPFIVGNSVALAREVTLPPSLRQGVKTEIYFKGASEVELSAAAATLSLALGVPIRVRADALLAPSVFAPRVAGAAAAPALASAKPITVNMQVGEMAGADILDHITHQSSNYWRFENGVVNIYRLVTRSFEVHAQSGKVTVSTGLGRSGSQGGSFESSSQTKVEQTALDVLGELKLNVEAMLTRGGSVVVGNGSLVVTDTKESVDQVADFLAHENRAMTRRIKLVFEAIEVTSKDNTELGVNWDLLYQRLAQLSNGALVQTTSALASPKSLASGIGAGLTMGVTGSSPFTGSTLVLDALAEMGSVVNHTRVPMMTLNRRPVQYAVRTNFDYVSSIQVSTVASSAGTTTAPAITQKEETVGTVLTVTPSAFEGGEIIMNLAYDNTILRSLDPYSVGAGASALSTVQQKTVDGSGTVQSVSIRSGQTLVISGIEKIANQFDQRRLDPNTPLLVGGSDRTKRSRSTMVLLVTALAEDGI